MPTPSLHVLIEGQPLSAEQAQGVWLRFSQHMDANQGDFEGFAKTEGYRYAAVAVENGRPTLKLGNSEPDDKTSLAAADKRPRKGGRKKKRRRKPRKKGPAR